MKVTVTKDQIVDGLQNAANVIPTKTGASYLRSMWLEAKNGTLAVMTTDASIEFAGTYPAQVEEEGLVGVQGRHFIDLVRRLPAGEIRLTQEAGGSTLVIEHGKNKKFTTPVSDPDWFQPFSTFPEGGAVALSGDLLQELLDRVIFCIGDSDAADAITCLCLKPVGNGRIDVCGLNGHQFALAGFINDDLAEKLPEGGLLIQKKHLLELKKWLHDDAIELHISEKVLHVRTIDRRESLTLPLAAHTYPDYNLFMDKVRGDNTSTLTLDRKEFMDSLGRIDLHTDNNCAYLTLTPTQIEISAHDKAVGSGNESLEATYNGNISRIAFPSRQLAEILGHFISPMVDMVLTGPEGPCCVSGADDKDYKVIVMPMKISDASFTDDNEGDA